MCLVRRAASVIEGAALLFAVLLIGAGPACGGMVDASDDGGPGPNTPTAAPTSCVLIGSAFVAPTETPIGVPVSVGAAARDPRPGLDAYAWSSTSGVFVDPKVPMTQFRCTEPGNVTLTLDLTDEGCRDSVTLSVLCE